MLIPSGIFRIESFVDKEGKEVDGYSEMALVTSDSGKKVYIEFQGNKKLEDGDVEEYFVNKADSVIKSKEIEQVAGELEFVDEFDERFETALQEEFGEEKPDKKTLLKFKKEFRMSWASEIVKERRRIKPGSIVRFVFAFSGKERKINGLPVIPSRSILFKDGKPSTTGVYYHSQTENQLPVVIEGVYDKDGNFKDFFTVSLSPIARVEHFRHLIDHMCRTVRKVFGDTGTGYVTKVGYDWERIKDEKHLFDLVKKVNSFDRKIESEEEVERYCAVLQELKEAVGAEDVAYIHPRLNLTLEPKFFKSLTESSPMTNLSAPIVNLNFSAENPDKKACFKEEVERHLQKIYNGVEKVPIHAVYSTPAIRLDEEPDSWGFLENNIQTGSFSLPAAEIIKLIKKLHNSSCS